MNVTKKFNNFHLSCVNIFAPESVVAQSMRPAPDLHSLWPHNTSKPIGKQILKRKFDFAGCDIDMPCNIAWQIKDASEQWHREFYSFAWIHEVSADNNQKLASSFIRQFINGFISNPSRLTNAAWETEIIGERLATWMQYRGYILRGSSQIFRKRLGKSLIRHSKELYKALLFFPEECGFKAIWGIISASSHIADMAYMSPIAEDHLEQLIAHEILGDGCHKSGNPEQHLDTLKTLIDIKELLPSSSSIYAELSRTIHRMGDMLRFFCHGDYRLALFNGGLMQDAALISRVIELSASVTDIPAEAPQAGFYRLERKRTTLIIKSRGKAELLKPQKHQGLLSFEFSDARERFVVNCGGYLGEDANWQRAVTRPAAHSTLMFEQNSDKKPLETPSAEESKTPDNNITNSDTDNNDLPTPNMLSGQDTEGMFVECSSNEYVEKHKIRHRRYIRLSKKGDSISGRDTIINEIGDSTVNANAFIRFHLHPDIRCNRDESGDIELTSVAGKSWLFSVIGSYDVAIEESVYLGYYGKPQKTQQIVVTPPIRADKVTISWNFKKQLA